TENQFTVTITSRPPADAPQDVTACASYTLPALTNGSYFISPGVVGTIKSEKFLKKDQPVFFYAGTSSCFTENQFTVTITSRPPADAPQDVTACASYTLPALQNGSYFISPGGVGPITAGTVITSDQTVYVYAGTSSCFTENQFTVTITSRPPADAPQNVTAC